MFDWLREYLEIRYEFRQKRAEIHTTEKNCESCDTLRGQLEIANYEKAKLLDRLLEKPQVEPERTTAPELKYPLPNKNLPWRIRQQVLEGEDRKKAQLLREFEKNKLAETKPTETKDEDIVELEKELLGAEAERESRTK